MSMTGKKLEIHMSFNKTCPYKGVFCLPIINTSNLKVLSKSAV